MQATAHAGFHAANEIDVAQLNCVIAGRARDAQHVGKWCRVQRPSVQADSVLRVVIGSL